MKQLTYVLGFILLMGVSFAVSGADNSLVLDLHLDNNPNTGDTPIQAADSSIYKNHGTINGATSTDAGIINGALSFDGLKDHVSISHSTSLNIAGTSPFSISMWVKGIGSKNNPNDVNPVVETLMTKQPEGSCSGGYYILYRNYDPNPNSNKRMYFGFSQGCSTESYVVSNKNDWEPDNWYNIVGTWDGTTSPDGMKLYINGELDATTTAKYPTIMQNTAALWIGAWTTGPNAYYKGLIDEVKIYKRALSEEEIKEGYKQGSLILYMPFDEGMGTSVNDLSGNGHNGLLVNGVSWTIGKKGSALVFDGSHYVDLGASTWFNRQTFTISLWVFPGTTQLQYADIIDNNHRNDISWVIQQNMDETNSYYFAHSTNSSTATYFELEPSVWSHLVVSRDGSSRESKVYINGLLVNSSISATDINYDGTEYLRLGKWGGWLWNGHYREWNGLMDEVKIYDRRLTVEEIKKEYDSAATTTTITENSTTTTINKPEQDNTLEDNAFMIPLVIMIVLAIFLFWAFFIKKPNTNSPEKERHNERTTIFCQNCGSAVSQGDKFCKSCGKNL
jgi:hypothetical protein